MVNWIWLGMIALSVIVGAANGRVQQVTEAAFTGAQTGVTVCFGLISILVFWMGLMKIAEASGIVRRLSLLMAPVVRWLFPDVPKDHPALGYILSNMSANLLGLGNAATPMGIRAMQELQKLNPNPAVATPAMCTLLALNTASITIVPTTLIAIRMNFGSAHPADIIGPTLLATAISTGAAIAADRWYRRRQPGSPPVQPPSPSSSGRQAAGPPASF
ncbi:nucleoside recognition domain-containing protein [Cohnella hashimotonis]|uniref:Nucleoside recognition domain-containing protein n=1 Tax=Cohnella hashimotonis TaxID=2826895 RepID=A0ABT6TF23_9BACL|nr:nucleoside recognition domain-containing protein [Cohnella hashimotonis]MDI4645438.1 nucleoside recognition domain-containing protein [Cohnella hashimotonis]